MRISQNFLFMPHCTICDLWWIAMKGEHSSEDFIYLSVFFFSNELCIYQTYLIKNCESNPVCHLNAQLKFYF